MNQVELLDINLLENKRNLKEIIFWQYAMNRPQGWHYDLDFLWILDNLKRMGLAKGSKILDAGAGLGPFQYILASKGYNIVSLDFSKRNLPKESINLFDIKIDQNDFNYNHKYQDFIFLENKKNLKNKIFKRLFDGSFFNIKWLYFKTKKSLLHFFFSTQAKLILDKKKFGKILFKRAAFHDVPYKSSSFDAVVSISAIEHAEKKLLEKNISEILRVLKPEGKAFLTTSSSTSNLEYFDEQTSGWCFSSESITKILGKEFSFEECELIKTEKSIINSKKWNSRLDPYYLFDKNSPFSKKDFKSLPYLPIGFILKKPI